MKIKHMVAALIFTISLSAVIYGANDNAYNVVQTPSAATIPRGFFWLGGFLYGDGGVGFNGAFGITDSISLGVSFPIDGVIGNNPVKFHIPSILAKIRLIGSDPSTFHLTIGYGIEGFGKPFYYYGDLAQGPFIAMRKGFLIGGLSQYFFINAGARYPLLPNNAREKYEASAFASLSLFLSDNLEIKVEVSQIVFTMSKYPIGSASIAYSFTESFSLQLDFHFTSDKRTKKFIFDRGLQINFFSLYY